MQGDDREIDAFEEPAHFFDGSCAAILDREHPEIRFAGRDCFDHSAECGLGHRLVLGQEFEACFVAERPRLALIGDPHAIRAPIDRIRRVKSGKLVAIIAAESTSTGCSEARPRTRKLIAMR